MTRNEAEAKLREIAREVDFLQNISMTLSWDMRVNLPKLAAEYRGDSLGYLSSEILKRKTSPELDEALSVLEEEKIEDDEVLAAMVKNFRKEYKYQSEIPAELNAEYAAHNLKCEMVWQEARKNNDFAMLCPWMEKEFDYLKKLAACHGFEDDPISGLMDEWEPGVTRPVMDRLFDELKAFELPFLDKIKSSPVQPDDKAYLGYYPKAQQEMLCHRILEQIGFDFDRGRMDVSAHPYTTSNDINDIRLTTSFHEDNFTLAMISCIHEGGHALHGLNASPKLRYTSLTHCHGAGMNESQSRYMENIIGRSLPFWEFALPVAQEYFPELKKFTPYSFYEALNCLHLHPNRLKADELTYNLHIILRYELEKQLFAGEIAFSDLPHLWNEKSREYLGVVPATDSEGVLQDMHWSSGYIGYFQTYVLGNFYDGHYYDAMRKDIPDMYDQVRRGEFSNIVGWQKEHVQQYGGMYEPAEILKKIDGEELNAKHYIDYISKKYSEIYKL